MFVEWIDEYKNTYIDEKQMKREIESFMQNYDEEKDKVS